MSSANGLLSVRVLSAGFIDGAQGEMRLDASSDAMTLLTAMAWSLGWS